MNTVVKFLKFFLFLSISTLFLGFLQAFHPLFDSFSHFRYHILVATTILLALLVILDKKRLFYGALFLISVTYLYIFPITYKALFPSKEVADLHIKHMQFNLNFRNKKLDSVLELLSNKKPDIVTMQEVTNAHRQKLESLSNSLYPYQIYCNFYPVVGGVAILSRYPTSDTVCSKNRGVATTKVDINGTKIDVASIHLYWPYPYSQYSQVDKFKHILNRLKNSKYRLIAGDFNAAPWSNITQIIAKESNTKVAGGIRWTISVDLKLYSVPISIKLPIDQLLLHNINIRSIEMLKHYGSDHYPVFNRLTIRKN